MEAILYNKTEVIGLVETASTLEAAGVEMVSVLQSTKDDSDCFR